MSVSFSGRLLLGTAILAVVAAACSSNGAAQSVAGATGTPAASAAASSASSGGAAGGAYGGNYGGGGASPASSASASSAGGSGATVMTATAGGSTVLVAGSNGMTVYTFAKDVASSGKSACSGACISRWPALTVSSGATPTAGSGVTGKLGTITRDDGTIQVTYNGLPLYFFSGDSKPGDTNGSYTGWNLVTP